MATKRLGKGLEALIGTSVSSNKKDQDRSPGVTKILISKIKTNPYQPRKEFDKNSLDDLAKSIAQKGVISPIAVRAEDNGYLLIAGERRLRASKINKLKEIPAYIIDVTDESDMMHLALIENIQRDNLNPMEESEAYAVLQNEFSLSQASIASSVGKSRSTIANSLRLLQLPSEARKYLKQNKISAGHARAILACKTKPEMLSLLKMIIRNDLSVRAAEKISHGSAKVKPVKKTINSTKNKSVRSLENELIAILGTKVHLNSKADKTGTILIEFFSEDDLSRILELLRSIDD